MTTTKQHAALAELDSQRTQAVALLEALLRTKTTLESQLSTRRSADAMRSVTGKSSIDNAIQETQQMIDSIDQATLQLKTKAKALDAATTDREAAPYDNNCNNDDHAFALAACTETAPRSNRPGIPKQRRRRA